jgi:hypothetical protein
MDFRRWLMAILLATIAFVLSMVALWFTSELARRSVGDAKTPHSTSHNHALNRAEAQIRDLSHDLELARREIKILRTAQGMPSAMPNAIVAPTMNTHALDHAEAFTPSTAYSA